MRSQCAASSLHLRAGELDRILGLRGLGREKGLHGLGVRSDEVDAEPRQPLLDRGPLQCVREGHAPLRRDLRQRALAGDGAEPGFRGEAGDAELAEGGQVRHRRNPRLVRHRDRAQRAGLQLFGDVLQVAQHGLHMAGHQVVHRRRAALVGHMHDVDAELALEHLEAEMVGRSRAERGERRLAILRLRPGHEFSQRLRRHRRIDHQDVRAHREQRHSGEVAFPVIGLRRHQQRRHQEAVGGGEQGVAVGRRRGHGLRRDGGAAAGLVLDHHRRLPLGGDDVGERAGDQVGAAARRERHHDADRMGGISVGAGRAGEQSGNEAKNQTAMAQGISLIGRSRHGAAASCPKPLPLAMSACRRHG